MSSSREVDIHCHLLPAWDDGPGNLNEALEMAKRAASHGVSDIFVTPHVGRDLSAIGVQQKSSSYEIPAAVEVLQASIRQCGLELKLWPGAELVIAPDLPARLGSEPSLTLCGANRYALVELTPGTPWTSGVDDILFQIALRGITPIVAHPERYRDVQSDLSCVQRAGARGVLFQLTAASLHSKGVVRDTSYRLLENGLVSFVASDAHTAHDVWPGQSREILLSLLGPEGCEKIRQNALALLPSVGISGDARNERQYSIRPVQALGARPSAPATDRPHNVRSFWSRFRKRRDQ